MLLPRCGHRYPAGLIIMFQTRRDRDTIVYPQRHQQAVKNGQRKRQAGGNNVVPFPFNAVDVIRRKARIAALTTSCPPNETEGSDTVPPSRSPGGKISCLSSSSVMDLAVAGVCVAIPPLDRRCQNAFRRVDPGRHRRSALIVIRIGEPVIRSRRTAGYTGSRFFHSQPFLAVGRVQGMPIICNAVLAAYFAIDGSVQFFDQVRSTFGVLTLPRQVIALSACAASSATTRCMR